MEASNSKIYLVWNPKNAAQEYVGKLVLSGVLLTVYA